MATSYHLDPEERDYFALVNRAVLTNPFSDQRERLDKEIAGRISGNDREHPVDAAIREVSSRLRRLRKDGRLDVSRYQGEDRRILARTLAFDIFYRHVDQLDQLIQDQLKNKCKPDRSDA